MHTERRKLLTIVAEAALEQHITKDIERLGAHGYTVSDARGMGSRGVRNAGWEHSGNVRIEVVCDPTLGNAIAAHLKAHYFDNFAMIVFLADVDVLRPEKF